jgi:hypothetical protein
LPLSCRKRVPNLRCWDGITGLKRRLGQFVNQPDGCPISFFSQSQTLIRFAADCLFRSAKRVLMTDLAWPAYLHLFQDTARKREASLHILQLEDLVFNDQIDASAVVDRLLHSYHAQGCDGIFLSDINYLGARLPVREFLNVIPKDQQPFVVVDAPVRATTMPVRRRERLFRAINRMTSTGSRPKRHLSDHDAGIPRRDDADRYESSNLSADGADCSPHKGGVELSQKRHRNEETH